MRLTQHSKDINLMRFIIQTCLVILFVLQLIFVRLNVEMNNYFITGIMNIRYNYEPIGRMIQIVLVLYT